MKNQEEKRYLNMSCQKLYGKTVLFWICFFFIQGIYNNECAGINSSIVPRSHLICLLAHAFHGTIPGNIQTMQMMAFS